MQVAERMAETDRRRAILTGLLLAAGYTLPARALRERIGLAGYAASLDRVRTDCAWLAEQGLLTWAGEVATLSERGADVLLGHATAPGVRRPAPGEL